MGADYGSFNPFIYTKVRVNRSQPRLSIPCGKSRFNINNGGLIRVGMFIWSLTLTVNSFSRLPLLGACGGPEKDRKFVVCGGILGCGIGVGFSGGGGSCVRGTRARGLCCGFGRPFDFGRL